MKDETNGAFDTTEIEERWNVRLWPTAEKTFGWGFIKLEPLFGADRCRYLMLDSDIVLVGPVIDALEKFESDFVVQREQQPARDIPSLYYDSAKVRTTLNPNASDPAFTFNTGQYVATSGLVRREDFGDLVVWSQPRKVRYPEIFNPSDQGVLNFVILDRLAAGALTVDRTPFMKWGREEMDEIDLAAMGDASPYPFVIHWAGLKKRRLRHMLRADILQHFERSYYDRVGYGAARKWARLVGDEARRWYERGKRMLVRA